jgi:hypothetical protein
MGYLFGTLFWGVVLLVEFERTPLAEWQEYGIKRLFLFRKTRGSLAFQLAVAFGALAYYVQTSMLVGGYDHISFFNVVQAVLLAAMFVFAFIYTANKKT